MYTVYKHTFPNTKVYIGITSLTVSNRWRNGKGYKTQTLIHRAIQKFGWDNIKHEILFTGLTKEEAEQKEIELIAEYKSDDSRFGYNVEHGGNCVGKCSDEVRKQRSERFSGQNNPMYGKGRKGSENPMYGKHWTEEQKRKHSEKVKGKLAGSKHPMYGKHWSEEHKKHISESQMGDKNQNAKIVMCVETGEIFTTVKEAGETMGINRTSISHCLTGKYKSAGGMHWMYAESGVA